MVASRNRPKGLRAGPFGLCILVFGMVPTRIGHQDVISLLTRQPEVTQRARAHMLASPFGTIHAATFSFPRPVGTMIPDEPAMRLASLSVGDSDAMDSIASDAIRGGWRKHRPPMFPAVNRRLKGDMLAPKVRPEPDPGGTRDLTPGRVKTVSFPRPEQAQALQEKIPREPGVASQAPDIEADVAAIAPQAYSVASLPTPAEAGPVDSPLTEPIGDNNPTARLVRLYFGDPPPGTSLSTIQPWPAEQELILLAPAVDPDLKRSAIAPASKNHDDAHALRAPAETVAPKGEVTGPGQRPKTPAERLGLDSKARAKAEKCLADAIYFESRGETKRGQIAVAQVVMNRVFSGYYPTNICGVVYQNAHRYNACQFTFACDGIRDVVNEPDMWEQAKQIARDTLDGKLWLSDIGKSTHYHAYWVHPWWVGTMRKLSRIGVHTFYRPRRWGDGSDEPIWGPGANAPQAKM
jgi:spore germination cell wall hydrolase CwlJ-like protein